MHVVNSIIVYGLGYYNNILDSEKKDEYTKNILRRIYEYTILIY